MKRILLNMDTILSIYKYKKSNKLIVIFSSCTRPGIKARYNYMNTLKYTKANQLFILDDYGEDQRGVYYLGLNQDFKIQKATKSLIDYIVDKDNISEIDFVGSSKGGYAALLFGLDYPNARIITGAPQYFLSQYLSDSGNYHIINSILGDYSEQDTKYLDSYLKNKILNSNFEGEIIVHCSKNEPTFEKHVKYILDDLSSKGIKYTLDSAKYLNHNDVGMYFSELLKNLYS